MKRTTTTILVMTLITAAICSAQEEKSKVKPPRVNIHVAAIQGNLKAIEQHIAAGTDLNIQEPEVGSTALITAATFGKTEVARALIEAGADLNMKNNDGSTALIAAAVFCHTEIVEMLLEKGADKTLINNRGSTALASVEVPYEQVKPIYEYIEKAFSPQGMKLDYKRIEATRPKIAELLR